jgi:hypothetical protein
MTDQFQKLLHSGAVDPALLTAKDQQALLDLFINSRQQQNAGGGASNAVRPSAEIRVS